MRWQTRLPMELWEASYRLFGMRLNRTAIVVCAAILTACTSDGVAPTIEPTDSAATITSSTTPAGAASTTTTMPPTLSDSGQSGFDNSLGTPERECVDVDQIVATEEPEMVGPDEDPQPVFDIRSGEFLAGNFASIVGKWSDWPGGEVKLYWVPFDWPIAFAEPLEVTVEPLDTDGPVVVQIFDVKASSAGGVFWPSGTKFPEPGRYRLTSVAPGHWGCFELTV